MKLLFDFFPVLLFFLSYKLFGIYEATAVAMAASLLQVCFHRLRHQHFEKIHVINLIIIVSLGSATLFFHNPLFIKWKPTGLYWITSLVFLLSAFFGKKPLIQKMMESNLLLPSKIWYRLNYAWVLFFSVMGLANLYVAYFYNTDTWVNFKLFGTTGFTLLFIFIQALYLTRHAIEPQEKNVIPSRKS